MAFSNDELKGLRENAQERMALHHEQEKRRSKVMLAVALLLASSSAYAVISIIG